MNKTIDIFYYAHQEPPWMAENIQALKNTTDGEYNLHVLIEPGTAHQNLAKCIERATTDRVVIFDDDACILPPDRNWLKIVNRLFDENPRVAEIVPVEIKDPKTRDAYVVDKQRIASKLPPSFLCPWLPGYCVCIDRSRVPDVTADVDIPCSVGASDLDISLQITFRGFDCLATTEFCVYHPWKSLSVERERCTVENDTKQRQYLYQKWGDHYAKAISKQLGVLVTLDNIGLSTLHRPD